jgi:uncharacterized GH25 family protein
MKRSALVVSTLLIATTAFAHDLWIEPSSFRPAVGERVTVALRVGQHLQGEPMPRIPALIDRFMLKGESREIPVIGRSGSDPAGLTIVGEPGLQWIGYQTSAYPMTVEAQKFESYLKEEGLDRIAAKRAKKGESGTPGRERFYRCAKSLLDVPGVDASKAKTATSTPLGFTLELMPRKNPYDLKAGDALPLSLTFRGKPIANVLVVAMRKEAPEKSVHARTDQAGRVSLRLDGTGFWLIKAVHMEAAPPDAGVDWESWWASMTFDLQGQRAK